MGKKIEHLKKCKELYKDCRGVIVNVPEFSYFLPERLFILDRYSKEYFWQLFDEITVELGELSYYAGFGDKSFGIRFDSSDNLFNLPFFYRSCPKSLDWMDERAAQDFLLAARKPFRQEFFISKGIAVENNFANVVIRKDSNNNCLVEYSITGEPQRYSHNKETHRYGVSDYNLIIWEGIPFRAFKPSKFNCLKLQKVFDIFVESDIKELTYSVKTNGEVVLW